MSRISLKFIALLPFLGADALEAHMPAATMPGLIAAVGMSPRPTHPPEVPLGLPKELARRRTTISYPAPGYYCGLVDNDINNLLTCVNAEAYCMYYHTAVGCCTSSDLRQCTDMPTSCVDWGQSCDSNCQSDPRVLSCSITTEPYCGTYFFESGTRLLGCYNTANLSSTVVMLQDYFSSELGPYFTTLLDGLTSTSRYIPTTLTSGDLFASPSTIESRSATGASVTSGSNSASRTGASTITSSSSSETSSKKGGGGISGGAIAGIVVGVIAVVAAFAAFLVWVFFIKRKKNPQNAAQTPPAPPMMQQQQPPYGPSPPGAPAAGYYSSDGKPVVPGQLQPPRYSTTAYDPKLQPPHAEQEIPEIAGNPLQQQSQPLLGAANQYYNHHQQHQPGSPEVPQTQPSEIDSTSPRVGSPSISNAGTAVSSISSPHHGGGFQMSHTAGPVPENIYEIGSTR